MSLTSIGDLAQHYTLRRQNTDLKTTLNRLTEEVASGRTSGTTVRLRGHFSFLTEIEHDLVLSESHKVAADEVELSANAMQSALGRITDVGDRLVESMATSSIGVGMDDVRRVAQEARGTLESIIAALNTSVGGRHLFSGVEVSQPAISNHDDLLLQLETALLGASTHDDVLTAAESFFDTGGGFEVHVYQGSLQSLEPFNLGGGESAHLDLTAADPAFRALLKEIAVIALLDSPSLSISDTTRTALLSSRLDPVLSAKTGIVEHQASLGFAEERIARAQSRLEAEATALQIARNNLLAVDPFEAASELEATSSQLETLYSVTARVARLSLANFL